MINTQDASEGCSRINHTLQTAIDDISDGLVVLDAYWRYTFVTPGAARMMRQSPEALLGRSAWEVSPLAEAALRPHLERARLSGQPYRFETYFPAPHDIWLACHCYPSQGELAVSFRDVTVQKRLDDQLRQNAAMLQSISDTSPDVIFAKDRAGRMRFANPAALALIGKGLDAVIGQTDLDFLDDKAAALQIMDNDRRIMETGVTAELEEPIPTSDGGVRVWLSRKIPYRDTAGQVVGLFGISRDITARKQADEALRESDRRKSEFLAMLSHELRNPLAPIHNALHLIERLPPGSPDKAKAITIMRRQTQHLTRLVDDLLDMTRISNGKIALQRARVDWREVVRKTTDDLRSVFVRSGVELRVAPMPGPVWVDVDATRMTQVLGNLLQNAVKFTPPGGRVDVRLEVLGTHARLVVQDTGAGIEPSQIEQMFEPFTQAEQSLARSKGGLGLGLALVKGLVQMHGGAVRAQSAGLGKGATFIVELPLAAPWSDAGDAGGLAQAPDTKNILIVEDNEDSAQTLADVLAIHGHQVRVALNGQTALSLVEMSAPDVILCDVGLPDMSGYEVAAALRSTEAGRSARMVALSGYAQPEDLASARRAGFDEHMAKPPDVDKLLGMLNTLAR
ncbi:MAG: PAS domain-containing protein [Acidobacteriota bacterium]